MHGLLGPSLAPRNLATQLVWVHYRGALLLVMLFAGNFLCMACPMVGMRDFARSWITPRWRWPRSLRNKWIALALVVSVLFGYELFDWWGDPRATAVLVLALFSLALLVDLSFEGASFCKHVCPVGQWSFFASTLSPLELRVADPGRCTSCLSKDCLRGRRDDQGGLVQRGCELGLFQPRKRGNMDCTFCLDCVAACPQDNVTLTVRVPGAELWDGGFRSGIGRLARRPDLGALATVFVFGALLNAFGMVSPVFVLQAWLSANLGLQSEGSMLGLLFAFVLVIEPALLLGGAALATRRATRARESALSIALRYIHSLVPFGFGVWLAHFSFHLLTGFWSFVPILQRELARLGGPALTAPPWAPMGLPPAMVYPLELGFLSLGLIGSWIVAWQLADRDGPWRIGAFLPWGIVASVLFATGVWILSQPMEMRGMIPS